MNNRRRLIIVVNRNLVKGGVELLNDTLINFAKENNLEPVSCHLEEVNEIARPSDYIYVQVEGRLSGAFRDIIEPVLEKGCLVFEKNVFALYSEFRPNHKNYFMILNVAVGGDWGGAQGVDDSAFPTSMEVDYVKAYKMIE